MVNYNGIFMIRKVKISVLLILGIITVSSSYPLGNLIYTINSLDSDDAVYKSFVKDVVVSRKFKNLSNSISLDDLNKYSRLPKLKLAKYRIKKDDNIVGIANNLYINPETLISVNRYEHISEVKNGSYIYLPNMKGVLHTIEKETTVQSISDLYDISPILIMYVNEIDRENLFENEDVFIPNGKISERAIEDFLGRVFVIPLSNPRISSPYGIRKDPFTGDYKMHHGVDYGAPIGESVYASQYGVVCLVKYSGSGYGNRIKIKHSDGYKTLYAHLSKIDVEVGQHVETGEKIGEVGNTGRSTGPHLHFEIRHKNSALNPYDLDNYTKDKPSFISSFRSQRSEDEKDVDDDNDDH